MGNLMNWQEYAVGAIVGMAVFSLVKHLRGMLSLPSDDADMSCHGCDSCSEPSSNAKVTESRVP